MGVRSEDQIGDCTSPLQLASLPVTSFQHTWSSNGLRPFRPHIEEIYEEIVAQGFGTFGENAVLGVSEVSIQRPETTDENRHFGSGERQEIGPVDQEIGRIGIVSFSEVVAEPVCNRLQNGEGMYVGLCLRGIHATRSEGNLHVLARFLCCGFDGSAAAENDQISD